MPKEDTQFKIGNPGGPGRPKGGRRVTLDKLDEMLAKAENLKTFEKALQEGFDKNPLSFWKTYVFPLLPQKSALTDPSEEEKECQLTPEEIGFRIRALLLEAGFEDCR